MLTEDMEALREGKRNILMIFLWQTVEISGRRRYTWCVGLQYTHNDECGDDTDIGGVTSENSISSNNISSIVHHIWSSARRLKRASVGEQGFVG